MTTTILEEDWGRKAIGRIEDDGVVYDDDWGGRVVARADGRSKRFAGAAALLLLLNW